MMTFKPEEIEQWHNDRKSVSDKIETDRLADREAARRANAVAVCIHCSNPFRFGEGHISEDVEICYVCLD